MPVAWIKGRVPDISAADTDSEAVTRRLEKTDKHLSQTFWFCYPWPC